MKTKTSTGKSASAKPDIPPPLAAFAGKSPPAPDWFSRALSKRPERSTVAVAGVDIETLAWGEIGRPGLLLVHGGMAHADWWTFVAPLLASTHRVAALSLSGMGGSGWRQAYAIEQYVDELFAVIAHTGLDKGPIKPVIMGHSFGGISTVAAGAGRAADLSGVILLDAPLFSPAERAAREEARPPSKPPRETRTYASEAEAIMRFRFAPPQTTEYAFIVDHIARHSLRAVTAPDGTAGVTWKFDPFMWSRLKRRDPIKDVPKVGCRCAVVWGDRSRLYSQQTVSHLREIAPKGTSFVEIPNAQHHVMVDQPLALVAAVRALLSGWGSA